MRQRCRRFHNKFDSAADVLSEGVPHLNITCFLVPFRADGVEILLKLRAANCHVIAEYDGHKDTYKSDYKEHVRERERRNICETCRDRNRNIAGDEVIRIISEGR